MSTELTLFQIDEGLAELIAYRAERLEDQEQPATDEERAAIDGEIRKYMEALPRKVAGITAILRKWESERETAQKEVKRYRKIIRGIEENEALLKDRCAEVLEKQPEPKKGARSLTGVDGSKLILKGNGGVEPILIDGWDAERKEWISQNPPLPDEYKIATVRMSMEMYAGFEIEFGGKFTNNTLLVAVDPNSAAIRAALAEPCPACKDIPMEALGVPICSVCDGSGKRGVPGCRLLPRGHHVEAR